MNRPDFYKVLGVEPGCSKAELKKAWQRAASKAHPDREGGSTERMAAVNEAYEALVDPVKRIRYDATGESNFKADALARDTIASLFAKYLDEPQERDIAKAARQELMIVQGNIDDQVKQLKNRIKRMKQRGPRFKVKQGTTNIAALVVARILDECEARLGVLAQDKSATDLALKILKDYEYEVAPVQSRAPFGSMSVSDWQQQTNEFWANQQR